MDSCSKYDECSSVCSCTVKLSSIRPGDPRRGSREPKIFLVTEAPDQSSSEGTAYEGTISNRIRSIFTEEKYGIGLPSCDSSFENFLKNHMIYATSAIKCYIGGSGSDIGSVAIENCKNEYLSPQIAAVESLELVIPMGKVATASVLDWPNMDFQLTDYLGKYNRGIQTEKHGQSPPIVVLPHPSGASPLSNPPLIHASDSRRQIKRKKQFRKALIFIRDRLDEIGYDVLEERPECWDSPDGLFSFF